MNIAQPGSYPVSKTSFQIARFGMARLPDKRLGWLLSFHLSAVIVCNNVERAAGVALTLERFNLLFQAINFVPHLSDSYF